MAVYDNPPTGKLNTKISPLIDGQLPDFIQSDHPVFSRFLKHYYQYLEAGELQLTVTIDKLLLNAESISYALDVDGNKIVLEDGAGTSGKFVVGDTITGATSKATATVLVDNLDNATAPRIFITSQQKFITGETVTGAISGSGVIVNYRANPIQTIQQLLDYADIDNTLYDFLDNFRDEFMNAIPLTLIDGTNKRNLLKNIRELYRAKGTSEGHKIFMRLLLGEDPEILYPNKYMMRVSDGNWANQTIMRVSPGANSVASEVVGTLITGDTSGATAVIATAVEFVEGNTLIVEFELNPDSLDSRFNFIDGEDVVATSTVQDIVMAFTVRNIVNEAIVTDRAALYGVGDPLVMDTNVNIGNGLAEARIDNINQGVISGISIDDIGSGYEVGDVLTFTTTDSNIILPIGFVSIVDGSIALDGTSIYYTDNNARRIDENDFIILEENTNRHLDFFEIELELHTTGSTGQSLLLDGTIKDPLANPRQNAGYNISMEWSIYQDSPDTYGTAADRWVLEEQTAIDLSYTSGSISRLHLKSKGGGFLTLPTVAVTGSISGTGAALLVTTDNIGSTGDIVIANEGFNYSNPPFLDFRANFTLKDVTGTFSLGNDLTSHTGEVVSFNSSTNVLTTTYEDVIRIPLETGEAEGIYLEDGSRDASDIKLSEIKLTRTTDTDEKIVDEQTGERIVVDATDTSDAYIVLEDAADPAGPHAWWQPTAGSAIVYEQQDIFVSPRIVWEYATSNGTTSNITIEDGIDSAANPNSGIILSEADDYSIGSPSLEPGHQLERMLTEGSTLKYTSISGAGDYIVTNFSIDESDSNVIFNGTDQYYTDEGDSVLDEETGDNNIIRLDGTDADGTDADGKLLHDIDVASGTDLVVLNGIDSSNTGVGDAIILQDTIDLFVGATGINPAPISITDETGATGKVVKSNIAKGTTTIATTVNTNKSYGVDIQSLIGEDLNRIQDSYYYQQFSYELSTGFGFGSYLSQLKKAVHPAGFAIFGKVKIASYITAGVQNAGSRLGDDYYVDSGLIPPEDKFSPILASTFDILFPLIPIQRRWGVPVYKTLDGEYEEQLILEDSEGQGIRPGDSILLESSTVPPTYLIEENPSHTDGRISLELYPLGPHSGHGASLGLLLLNGTDASSSNSDSTFALESTETYTSNLVFDGTEDYGYYSDAGSDVLLEGTDSSKSNAGESFELEDASMGIEFKRFGLYARPSTSTLLNEAGGTMQTEESSAGGGANYDLAVVSYVVAKINLPLTTPKNLSTGLITIGRTPFINSSSGIQLEKATGGERLIMDWNYVSVTGRAPRKDSQGYTLGGPGFAVEHGYDPIGESAGIILENGVLGIPSNDYGFTFEEIEDYITYNIVMNGTSVDAIILDGTNADGDNAGGNILLGGSGYSSIVFADDGDILKQETVSGSGFNLNENDNVILNGTDSSGSNAGSFLTSESIKEYDFYTMSDIIRPDILLISSDLDHHVGTNADPGVGILLEGSEDGKFKQEDAATAAGGVSYDILLEHRTGFGLNNKLIFDGDRVELEDSINQGTIPYQNYTSSTLHHWTRPSHITTSEYGGVALEDSIVGQLLVDGTDGSASDAGSKFKFEYFTDDFTHWQAPHVSFSPTFGRFDSTIVSWDSQNLGRDDYPESEPKTFDQPY